TGEVVAMIDLYIKRKGHVVTNKFEPMMVEQTINIALRASEEIVDAYDVSTISEQSLTEMRAKKAGSPGNQYARFKMHTPEFPLYYPTTIGSGVPSMLYVPYRKAISYLENEDAIKKPSDWTDPGTPPHPPLTISPAARSRCCKSALNQHRVDRWAAQLQRY